MTVAFIFIFGLIFGSFLSVVFSRLEIDETGSGKGKNAKRKPRNAGRLSGLSKVVGGRSRCDHCGKSIAWFDNIPLFSFLLLQGKCRHCGKSISHYHPALELSSALYLVAAYLYFGLSLQFAVAGLFGLILLVIFSYDLRHHLIPNVIVLPAILAALVLLAVQFFLYQSNSATSVVLGSSNPAVYLLGGAIIGGFFLLISLISKGAWIGGGDIKLGLLIGLLLGWPIAVVALILAYFIGTVYALLLLVTRQADLKTQVAFGPMLVMGFFISEFYGDLILRWYQSLVIPGVGV